MLIFTDVQVAATTPGYVCIYSCLANCNFNIYLIAFKHTISKRFNCYIRGQYIKIRYKHPYRWGGRIDTGAVLARLARLLSYWLRCFFFYKIFLFSRFR